MNILGVILAGGKSRRMGGGDKCLTQLGNESLLQHVHDRLRPQVDHMVLSANGAPERFADCDIPVIADSPDRLAGPLAGILTAMEWAAARLPDVGRIVSVAADTPFFPEDLVSRLIAACDGSGHTVALATSNGVTHPVFGLWPVALRADLVRWGRETENPRVMAWAQRHPLAKVPFDVERLPNGTERDPFFNINTPEDLARAASLVAPSGA